MTKFTRGTTPRTITSMVILGGVVALAFVVVFAPWFLGYCWPDTMNAFGDSFGFANAIFSLLGLLALLWTLILQSVELYENRNVQLLAARMNSLSTLIPELPEWQTAGEAGEEGFTTQGLNKQLAAAELEFLLEWARGQNNQFLSSISKNRDALNHAIHRLIAQVSDVCDSLAPIEDRRRSAAIAYQWAKHIESLDAFTPLTGQIASSIYQAGCELSFEGNLRPETSQLVEKRISELQGLHSCT